MNDPSIIVDASIHRKESLLKDLREFSSDQSETPKFQKFVSWASWIPLIKQLRNYEISFLLADFSAGLTIAFVLVPQAIAFCALANLPPIMALTSAVFPVWVYSIFGSSRHLAVGRILHEIIARP